MFSFSFQQIPLTFILLPLSFAFIPCYLYLQFSYFSFLPPFFFHVSSGRSRLSRIVSLFLDRSTVRPLSLSRSSSVERERIAKVRNMAFRGATKGRTRPAATVKWDEHDAKRKRTNERKRLGELPAYAFHRVCMRSNLTAKLTWLSRNFQWI